MRVGWRLTLEPSEDMLAWSLIRVDDRHQNGQVWSGLLTDAGHVRDLVTTCRAAPDNPWSSPLVDPSDEALVARELGSALLPRQLREALCNERESSHTVTIATRGWPAAAPWDALALEWNGTRLIERARVLGGMSPGLVAGLTGSIRPQGVGRLWVVDPGPATDGFSPLSPAGPPTPLIEAQRAGDELLPSQLPLSADDLGEHLRSQSWQSLVYVGHLRPAPAESPGGAALVLTDRGRPSLLTARSWLSEPDVWPAPRRVALIGCSGDDAGAAEQSGLVVAAMAAGAGLVTTTRWPLPNHPAVATLAVAVGTAMSSPDPGRFVGAWQQQQLAQWRAHGGRGHSPLLWSSLVGYDLERLTGTESVA